MKKIYTSLVLSVLYLSSFAQNTSNLIIFSEDGLKFYLILNGIRQNDVAVTNVKVIDLNQPYYTAKIIFEDKNQPPIDKKYLSVTDPESKGPTEVTYKIKRNNKGTNVMRFYSQVPLSQAVPLSQDIPVYHYNVTPMPEISTTIVTQETTYTTGSGNANTNVSVNAGGIGVNINVNEPVYHENVSTSTTSYTTTTTTSTSNSGNYYNNNNTLHDNSVDYCGNNYAMNKTNFDAAKKTISNQSFEDTKLSTALQILKSNCLNTEQIKQMMLLFNFEASRLDVAKNAYARCVDKNNYFIVNDAFNFSSSVEELNNYIK